MASSAWDSRLRSGFDIVPADKDNVRNLSNAESVTADGACTPAYVIGPVCSSWGHRIRRARGLEGQLQSAWAAYSLTTDRRISQEAADELQICRFRETQRVSWTEVAGSVPAASPRLPRSDSPWFPGRSPKPAQEFPTRNGLGCTFLGPYRQVRTGDVNAGSLRTPFHPARGARTFWQCWQVPTSSGTARHPSRHHGSGCPQLNRPAATGSAAKVSHLLSSQQRLRAHATAREDVRAGGARNVSLRTAVAADLCHQSRRRRWRLGNDGITLRRDESGIRFGSQLITRSKSTWGVHQSRHRNVRPATQPL
jgi:hypothetical protein